MQFTKVHGAGNDFIIIDATKGSERDYASLAPILCNRQTGIGADGLLIALPSDTCDIRMRIINQDGSEAEMCGNGIRAFGKYVYERKLVQKPVLTVETIAGVIIPELLLDENGKVNAVRVNMGKPSFDCKDIPAQGEGECLNRSLTAGGRTFSYSSVRMNIPHTGIEVENAKTFDLYTYGPIIEHLPLFPERTNVDFYHVLDHENVEMRVWERGAGATLACGTGACATAVLCAALGKTGRKVNIHLQLATLFIEWAEDGSVYMTGPAELVFDGEMPEPTL